MAKSGHFIDTGLGYKAFQPIHLQDIEDRLDMTQLHNALEEANIAIGELRGLDDLLPNAQLLTNNYAIKEALLSSQIEGTQSTLSEVMAYKEYDEPATHDILEVLNYLKALDYGVKTIEQGELPICNRLLKKCHQILMLDVRGGESENTPGEFRKSQNFIGGNQPANAFFVPPVQHEVVDLMGALEKYIHESKLPNLIKVALIHYQFETIHPFLDGNGRIGRLLIILYLIDRGILQSSTLYISLYLKKNQMRYYDYLTQVRQNGNYEQWIKFFLQGISLVSKDVMETTRLIRKLQEEDTAKIKSDNEYKLLDYLFNVPTITIKEVAKELQITNKTANNLVTRFENKGILMKINDKKRYRKYFYRDYHNILGKGLI